MEPEKAAGRSATDMFIEADSKLQKVQDELFDLRLENQVRDAEARTVMGWGNNALATCIEAMRVAQDDTLPLDDRVAMLNAAIDRAQGVQPLLVWPI